MAYSRLRRSSDQRKALLRDLVTDLILNGRIETTVAKAKELKRVADKMVTLGKTVGTDKELHARRQAASFVRFEKAEDGQYAIQKLFGEIAPKFASRNGGYTRVIKTGFRRGDAAPMAIIEWVE